MWIIRVVDWRLFGSFWTDSILENAAVIPCAPSLSFMITAHLPMTLSGAIALQLVMSGAFFAMVIFPGLVLGHSFISPVFSFVPHTASNSHARIGGSIPPGAVTPCSSGPNQSESELKILASEAPLRS